MSATAEQQIHDALVTYQNAVTTARANAKAAYDALAGDPLATTLNAYNVLQSVSMTDMYGGGVAAAITALEARMAATATA